MKYYRDCKYCTKPLYGYTKRNNLFCNADCHNEFKKDTTKKRILNSGGGYSKTIKRVLIDEKGHQCCHCKLSLWQNKPIPLELDHINGNSTDNAIENLRLLCPNCHALTDTYKGKNIGNGRQWRMQRYKAGKSF